MFRLARLAEQPEVPSLDELGEIERDRALSRREWLKASGVVLVARRPALKKKPSKPSRPTAPTTAHTPRIAVVGAGMAGLRATYVLKQAGYRATLYSADTRVGGRIWSVSERLAPGVTTEFGGEFIDSSHREMHELAREFDLELYDLATDHLAEAYYFRGQHLTDAQVIAAFQPLAARINADLVHIPDVVTYYSKNPYTVRLDRMSIAEYLDRAGVTGWLYDLLRVAYIDEDGQEIEQQSSLDLITQIGTNTRHGFKVVGESDERYKVKGGNLQIIAGLTAGIFDQIEVGYYLEAIRSQGRGFVLTFQTNGGPVQEVAADIIILAIPFSILRNLDVRVELPPIKRTAIVELGYGTNAKMMLGTRSRPWRTQGYNGDFNTDQPFQTGYDHSRAEPTPAGGVTLFLGGDAGVAVGEGSDAKQVGRFLPGLDQIFPGTLAAFNGQTARAYWPGNPFVHGSYSNYTTGQATSFGGAEAFPVGNLFFAGEHCDFAAQGYMNGAALTGRLAAEGVLKLIRR